jgi:hypothetical protein
MAMVELGLVESVERVLIGLYRNSGALERLLSHAKLTITEFDFNGQYDVVLNRCLEAVKGQGKLDEVVKSALRDYPDNVELRGLSDRFDLEMPINANIAKSAERLSGFLVLLRRSRHLTRNEFKKLDAGLQHTFDLTTIAESRRKDGDVQDQWDDIDQKLTLCVRQLQLYRELVDASVTRRVPGAVDERLPLAELAADKATLIDAKQQLWGALADVIQACQVAD